MELTETLGILVAFITIILILSILVTALVQTIQAIFHLRAKNLRHGIETLLKNARDDEETDNSSENAALLLNEANPIGQRKIEKNHLSVTWLDSERFKNLIDKDEIIQLTDEQRKNIVNEFDNLYEWLSKRFETHIRYITFACALAVAVAYQVSTPALLKDFSTDPKYRSQIITLAENILDQTEQTLESLKRVDYGAKAIAKLSEQYPDYKESIEEASGIDTTNDALAAEIELVLSDTDKKGEIVDSYNKILTALYEERRNKSLGEVRDITNSLGLYSIQFWSKGIAYYKSIDAIFGVLMTAILISLGAPFWFEILQKLLVIRKTIRKTD